MANLGCSLMQEVCRIKIQFNNLLQSFFLDEKNRGSYGGML